MLGVAACTTTPQPRSRVVATVIAEPRTKTELWKEIATDADEQRLARVGLAWQEALQDAQRGFGRETEAEGALLRPRAALARPATKQKSIAAVVILVLIVLALLAVLVFVLTSKR